LKTGRSPACSACSAALKEQGTGIVYVSHRLEEIVALADRCTVLRDGRVAAVVRHGEFNSADLVAAMTGRASERPAMAANNARRGVA
jgi:ABC-type sugar transport system ATPase subunit